MARFPALDDAAAVEIGLPFEWGDVLLEACGPLKRRQELTFFGDTN